MLVESAALEKAEEECLDDAEARARRRERAAERRAELDLEFVARFASRIRDLFPACPESRETDIAEHACLKHSGRVGRSAAAKSLDEDAVRFAVIAHIRHAETKYDEYLGRGWDRWEAREEVEAAVFKILERWSACP